MIIFLIIKDIPTPSVYLNQKYILKLVRISKVWNTDMIDMILKNENYVGNSVQGKRKRISHKTHNMVRIAEDDWIIYNNHHKAIIDKDTFNKVQQLLKVPKRNKTSNGEDILSGYFKCKDCGESMYIKKGKNKDYYYCKSYLTNGICTNHSIEKNKLYDEILKQMNLKRVENKEIKKLTRNRIVKYIDNIFIHEDKSIEINFKEDINSI